MTISRDTVLGAFKGVMNTYELLDMSKRRLINDDEYISRWKFFYSRSESGTINFELFYKRQIYEKLINYVDQLFDGQTDRQFVSMCLEQVTAEWIEAGNSLNNQALLEQTANDFLDRVEDAIKVQGVYVPVEGIKINSSQFLQLARCQLHRNDSTSEFMEVVNRHQEKFSKERDYSGETIPVYCKVNTSGHFKRAIQQSKDEVELALNVLRLFIGSYYLDIHVSPSPKYMGIIGTTPAAGEHSNIFSVRDNVPIEDQQPGHSVSFRHRKTFELDGEHINALKNDDDLARVNQLLCSIGTRSEVEIASRLQRAINWFGKASRADSIAESFLLYTISIEALLSEGRTPKETYAIRMAALWVRAGEGYLSAEFARKVNATPSNNDRFEIVRKRVVELFNYRNNIVHGKVLENEIDILNLLDFETLVHNSILSFVNGSWDTLEEFKMWLNNNLPSGYLISTKEASSISGLSIGHLRKLLREQKIRGMKVGNNWKIYREALLGYVG